MLTEDFFFERERQLQLTFQKRRNFSIREWCAERKKNQYNFTKEFFKLFQLDLNSHCKSKFSHALNSLPCLKYSFIMIFFYYYSRVSAFACRVLLFHSFEFLLSDAAVPSREKCTRFQSDTKSRCL